MLIIDAKSELRRVTRHEKLAQLAQISLAAFVRYRFYCEGRALLWNWHLDCISEHLEAVTRREILRLLINIPPRFLKSEMVSQSWQAWMVGCDDSPRSSMVSASYSATLAARDSLKTLNLIRSPWYRHVFPDTKVGLTKETEAEWITAGGASRVSAGSGGTVTGQGGDHLVGDDLLKPQEANSELIRNKINDWLGETFHSRLNDPKTGTKTFIGQRLHEKDPFGHMLDSQKNPEAEQFTHLCLPLENVSGKTKVYHFGRFMKIRRPNELLHPERFGQKQVREAKLAMRSNYEGQYNQRPNKLEGGQLKPSLLVRVDKTPQAMVRDWGLTPLAYVDLAATQKQRQKDDPDYSVIELWARDQLNRKILLHVWRDQCSMNVTAGVLYDLRKTWGIRWVKGEKGPLQQAFRAQMSTTAKLRKVSQMGVLDFGQALGDKGLKIAPFEGDLNAGIIVVPAAATWLPDFEAEMATYPKGAHDDQIDIAGQACNDLDNWAGGEVPENDVPTDPINITGAALRKAKQEKGQSGAGWKLS